LRERRNFGSVVRTEAAGSGMNAFHNILPTNLLLLGSQSRSLKNVQQTEKNSKQNKRKLLILNTQAFGKSSSPNPNAV
jgi:hypothetical protein